MGNRIEGDPQGQSPQTQADPPVGGGQSAADWKSDPRFAGDPEKVFQSLKSLESKMGEQSGELGTLRKTKEQYDAFYGTLVQTPDGRIIDKAHYEAEQAAANRNSAPAGNANAGQPTDDQIREKLAELRNTDDLAYFNVVKETAKREMRAELSEREKVFSNPIASQNQRIRQSADELLASGRYSADEALAMAVGREAMAVAAAAGGNPGAAPTVIPNVLANQNRGSASFMQPGGTIPASTPEVKRKATPEQIAVAAKFHFSAEDIEPYAGRG
jgi:hypothetical protein